MSDRFFSQMLGKAAGIGSSAKGLGSKIGGEIKFRLEIRGMRSLAKKLDRLGKSVTKPMLSKAVTAAYRPIRDEVKRNAKAFKDTGTLWRAITTKKYKVKYKKGIAAGGVGARYKLVMVSSKKRKKKYESKPPQGLFHLTKKRKSPQKGPRQIRYNPGNYAHLVEFGTKFTARHARGRFMTPGIRKMKREAERIMITVLKQEIQKRIDKISAGK